MFIIGIAGGTCSGKSTLAAKLADRYGASSIGGSETILTVDVK